MKSTTRGLFAALAVILLGLTTALTQQKPNILVIFGDDVGIMNLSAYHREMMGGSTPNLDRIANEGVLFRLLSGSVPLYLDIRKNLP